MTDFDTSDRDVTRAIRSWLHEDRHEDASRIAGAVLDQVDTTRQRRSWWPAWRSSDMNGFAKFLVATAAVVVVAVAGINLLPGRGSGTGSAQPSPSPIVSPTTSLQPTPARIPDSGPIDAGTYLVSDGQSEFRVTFPAGWDVFEGRDFRKNRDQTDEIGFLIYQSDIAVYPDACANDVQPPLTGPTTTDLIAALNAQENSDVSEPVDVTIGGLPGLRIEVSIPEGLDEAGCFEGLVRIWTGPTGGNYLVVGETGPGSPPVHMVDTPSGRIVLDWFDDPEASDADVAELAAIVDSIQFEPAP